ncbi:MAG: YggS family pyridoxal phosphate-dependent enzyme [Candidatus Schekmanbacteria bacterium]|nr:MAG: YggS family pyridoxal phosphate-dependent enzyme [Candidatus Schekmanbacteria bacterium]
MSAILENYKKVLDRIEKSAIKTGRNPSEITLVAVSKTFPLEKIEEAYDAGARIFGENYIQEAVKKIESFTKKVSWHFIGHLQTNKVKYAVGNFDFIEAVDSLKLCKEIDKRAGVKGIKQKILLEVNLSGEESKYGFSKESLIEEITEIGKLRNISVEGLMTMPPFSTDPEDSRRYFIELRELRDEINSINVEGIEMKELSMGMSNDFEVAIEEGATIVRVGTLIFGQRG